MEQKMLLNYLKQGTEYALAALMAAGAAVCVAQLVSKGKLTRTQRIKILLTAGQPAVLVLHNGQARGVPQHTDGILLQEQQAQVRGRRNLHLRRG